MRIHRLNVKHWDVIRSDRCGRRSTWKIARCRSSNSGTPSISKALDGISKRLNIGAVVGLLAQDKALSEATATALQTLRKDGRINDVQGRKIFVKELHRIRLKLRNNVHSH